MLTHTPRIPGLDGRKMSKSYGNAIMLSESDEDIRKKTKVMVTDPQRKRRQGPRQSRCLAPFSTGTNCFRLLKRRRGRRTAAGRRESDALSAKRPWPII